MSESEVDELGDLDASLTPPVTGNAQIDAALTRLSDLNQLSAEEQLQRLRAAHDLLVSVLDSSRTGSIPMPKPGVRSQ